MIDTAVLTIEGGSVRAIKGTSIPEWDLHSRDKGYSKFVKTLNKKEKEDGIYRPRISGIKRGKSRVLRVEFSVQKLLYRNSVDEVCANDLEEVVETLRRRLAEQGILVSEQTIKDAKISPVHFSKNIILGNGYTVSTILRELSKVNLTQKMELSKQTFYNGGESVHLWSKSHSFVIYDKKREYCKSKRKIDPETLSFLSELHLLPEILRLEVRFAQKRKLNEMLKKLGYAENPKFKDIFDSSLCQKIIEYYWRSLITDRNRFLFSSLTDPQNFLRMIRKNHSGIKQKQAVYLVGLMQLAKDDGGITGLRKTLDVNHKGWDRLVEHFSKFDFLTESGLEWVDDIEEQISTFEPIRLSKLCKVL